MACRLPGLSGSISRRTPMAGAAVDSDVELRQRLRANARAHPRWGFAGVPTTNTQQTVGTSTAREFFRCTAWNA
jgi:hypothetical protein